ncbi:Thiol-disulfide isomerase or thioredoxin [Arenibacter nanhaiticus]|uniref:Thiol-disulfide isomerase or thioredoxin n=1 Tax=Arenibacter nanhaiticus TaxID=558155 RepID=A0A1M6IDD4_9FLAO|nr:TlpA disulfide reductase family protein [Arenibacter nanhaiticus]SHJ32447.1 Thiol-disulfide isomerase or thioredoxin [Arenibacter nanhaiticus]
MKKIEKKRLVTLLMVVALVIFLFTPVGFHIKVQINRLLAFNPTPVAEREQQTIGDYDWKLRDLQDSTFYFEAQKGQVILVNFWATWCPPCVAEMPSLQQLYNDYGDKVVFVFVAQDQEKRVKQFLTQNGYELPVYFEASTTPTTLFSKSIPATYIVDKSGKIIVAKTGAADWNSDETRKLLDQLVIQ